MVKNNWNDVPGKGINQIKQEKLNHKNINSINEIKDNGIIIEIGYGLVGLFLLKDGSNNYLFLNELRKKNSRIEKISIRDTFFLNPYEYCIIVNNKYRIINEFKYVDNWSEKYFMKNYCNIVNFANIIFNQLQILTISNYKKIPKRILFRPRYFKK